VGEEAEAVVKIAEKAKAVVKIAQVRLPVADNYDSTQPKLKSQTDKFPPAWICRSVFTSFLLHGFAGRFSSLLLHGYAGVSF
jgi:hypothetical protein